jgi:hypothetical protein
MSSDTLSILYPELDTIEVKVTIYPNAQMKFEPQFQRIRLPMIPLKLIVFECQTD